MARTFATAAPPKPAVFGRGFLFGIAPRARQLLEGAAPHLSFDALDWLAQQPGALFDLLTRENEANRIVQNKNIAQLNSRDSAAAEDGQAQAQVCVKRSSQVRAILSIHRPISGPDHKYAERFGTIIS